MTNKTTKKEPQLERKDLERVSKQWKSMERKTMTQRKKAED